MIPRSGLIYSYDLAPHGIVVPPKKHSKTQQLLGLALLFISLGGIAAPFIPRARMEFAYSLTAKKTEIRKALNTNLGYTPVKKVEFNPLVAEDGSPIVPVNSDFSLVIPKIGVNAQIIAGVNPLREAEYAEALKKGIAHSSLSYFPDQNGTVYLFSHSTNYEWFVSDLNAAFYLLKNLESGDMATVVYKGKNYTYKITEKRIVSPNAISYLVPEPGSKTLILETCWPPGSTTERLLIIAELIQEQNIQI